MARCPSTVSSRIRSTRAWNLVSTAGRIAQHPRSYFSVALATSHPLPALADDLRLRYAHIREEDFIEPGDGLVVVVSGRILDSRRLHREDQIRNTFMLGFIRLRAYQTENHVRLVRGAGPYLLAVDDEIVAIFSRLGPEGLAKV